MLRYHHSKKYFKAIIHIEGRTQTFSKFALVKVLNEEDKRHIGKAVHQVGRR